MATITTTIRQLRRTVRELQDELTAAEQRANQLANELSGVRISLRAAQVDYWQATEKLARREGYIDRVREVEGSKQLEPGLSVDAVDKLREHLTSCPEEEASKILDVISEDLKRRVTGLPDPVKDPLGFKFNAGDNSWSKIG